MMNADSAADYGDTLVAGDAVADCDALRATS